MKNVMLAALVIIFCVACLGVEAADSYDREVYEVQKKLKELGYDPGNPDGVWGKKTTEALESFQGDNGLPVTGKLNELTKSRLNAPEDIPQLSISEAVRTNDISQLKALLDAGADVSSKDKLGETPLHVAAIRGYTQAAELLIMRGADIEAGDVRGLRPVHAAAWRGNDETLELLISKGADINARDQDGVTPLHAAALAGRSETVALLIARGADVNVKNNKAMTPLHAAVLAGDQETVAELIAGGADVGIKNENGLTPIQMASQYGHREIVEYLRKQADRKAP
jgi:ankyrin repeat protein